MGRAFPVWPDDALPSEKLDDVYSGKTESPLGPVPFLDNEESSRLSRVLGERKDVLFSPFAGFLRKTGVGQSRVWGGALLALQSLLTFELRKIETQERLWDRRTPRQKQGALFAVSLKDGVEFCRVSALPGYVGERVCVPWGGPYASYLAILPLLETGHARLVLDSASAEMEVVPEAHVIRRLQAAGVVKEHNRGFTGSRWTLTIPRIGPGELSCDLLDGIRHAAQGVSAGVAEILPNIVEICRFGRHAGLTGHGDYVEMAYGVLMSLLCRWAMEESMLLPPPSFDLKPDGAFVERSFVQRIRGEYPALPSIAILSGARRVWDFLRRYE